MRIEDSANLAYHFLLFCDDEDFPRFSDCFFVSLSAQAQLLIVAVFGDELNSGKIEFGLDDGYNRSWYLPREDAKGLNYFNSGFFFHIKMTENSTGFTSPVCMSNPTWGLLGCQSIP